MKLQLIFLLIASGLNPGAVIAQDKPAPTASSTSVSEEAAVLLLAQDLAPLVKHPKKSFRSFHYNPRTATGMKVDEPYHSQRAMDYLHSKSERFWKQSGSGTSSSMMGDGLYLASDPVVTIDYGTSPDLQKPGLISSDFALVEVDFTPESAFLDIASQQNQILISRNTSEALRNLGCLVVSPGSTRDQNEVKFSEITHSSACQKILNPALRALGVSALAYTYTSQYIKSCKGKDIAFVLIDPGAVRSDQVSVLHEQIDSHDPAALREAQIIYKITQEALEVEEKQHGMGRRREFENWAKNNPELERYNKDPFNRNEVNRWKKEKLPFCDKEDNWAQLGVKKLISKIKHEKYWSEMENDSKLGFNELPQDQLIKRAVASTADILNQIHSLTDVATMGCPSPRILQIVSAEMGKNDQTRELKYCEGLSTCIFSMDYLNLPQIKADQKLYPPVHVIWKCSPDPAVREGDFAYALHESLTLKCP